MLFDSSRDMTIEEEYEMQKRFPWPESSLFVKAGEVAMAAMYAKAASMPDGPTDCESAVEAKVN